MLKFKKIIALMMAVLLALGAMGAVAEESAEAQTATETEGMPGQPPEMPDGENGQPPEPPQGDMNGERPEPPQGGMGQPPQMPDGQMPGQPPEMDGQQPPEMPEGGMPGDMGGMPGGMGSSAPTEYAAAATVTGDSDGESFASETADESAVLVSGDSATLTGATITKTGDSDGESADFYGINAAVLAVDGATLTLDGATITTDGTHANGVFSYGSGTTVNVTGTTITTTGDNSGGLMTTGGGMMIAEDCTVSTAGRSSAAIRSDRGGGTVNVTGGSYATNGIGSPAIYSTADITVTGATLSASNSEAVVIEGGNSITLNDVDITGCDATLNGQSVVKTNALIYQSMSGDAAEGNSTFTMAGGSMTAETGCMFHVTNVTTTISLSGVRFTYADDSDVFLSATADSWGNAGSNGGHATLNLAVQEIEGNLIADESSSLALNLTEGSRYTGAINPDGAAGSVSVTIDESSTWTLTADSFVDSLDAAEGSIDLNGYTLTVNGEVWNG